MITTVITLTLAAILAAIGILHIYWAFGGNWMAREAIPTNTDGTPLFAPGPAACFVVAIAALGAAALLATRLVPALSLGFPTVHAVFPWLLCGAFALRAVGEFKYCGLFKRVRGTLFARYDTRVFTPLCFVLSVLAGVIALASR